MPTPSALDMALIGLGSGILGASGPRPVHMGPPSLGSALGAGLGNAMQAYAAFGQPAKPPQTRTIQRGRTNVTQEWRDGKWTDIASGAMDAPAKPAQRRIVKGADGFNYYEDTGERVLPKLAKTPEDTSYQRLTVLVPGEGEPRVARFNPKTGAVEVRNPQTLAYEAAPAGTREVSIQGGVTDVTDPYRNPRYLPKGYEPDPDTPGALRVIAGSPQERELNLRQTQVEGAAMYARDRADRVIDLAMDAQQKADLWTTGFMGSQLAKVPGTPAHDLWANIDTIKANVGFEQLQIMRDNSKTGGALGQVSEFENRLLQAAYANVIQSQSPEQLRENLSKLQIQVRKSWQRVRIAFEKDYGKERAEMVLGEQGRAAQGWTVRRKQ